MLPGVKIDYRRGYYAPADYQHSTKDDKERQLEEELASEMPTTDLPLYLGVAYFRLEGNKFFVPISLVVPGSQIPFVRSSDRDKATLDVIGMVLDSEHHPLNRIRDTVKLAVNTSTEVQKKNVQYDTGMSLLSGKYHLKFVVRENQTGRMGSFETDIEVPDLKTQPLKMSSVVLASQTQPAKKSANLNPLVRDGSEIIPNITHVFSATQHLFLYYEVYDPARPGGADPQERGAREQVWHPALDQRRVLSGQGQNLREFAGRVDRFECARAKGRRLPVGRAAHIAQARLLYLPGQCDRRCRRTLPVSAAGFADPARESRTPLPAPNPCPNLVLGLERIKFCEKCGLRVYHAVVAKDWVS